MAPLPTPSRRRRWPIAGLAVAALVVAACGDDDDDDAGGADTARAPSRREPTRSAVATRSRPAPVAVVAAATG